MYRKKKHIYCENRWFPVPISQQNQSIDIRVKSPKVRQARAKLGDQTPRTGALQAYRAAERRCLQHAARHDLVGISPWDPWDVYHSMGNQTENGKSMIHFYPIIIYIIIYI